jgi:hypothetical protein
MEGDKKGCFFHTPTLPRAGGDCRGNLMKNKECGNPYTPKCSRQLKDTENRNFKLSNRETKTKLNQLFYL